MSCISEAAVLIERSQPGLFTRKAPRPGCQTPEVQAAISLLSLLCLALVSQSSVTEWAGFSCSWSELTCDVSSLVMSCLVHFKKSLKGHLTHDSSHNTLRRTRHSGLWRYVSVLVSVCISFLPFFSLDFKWFDGLDLVMKCDPWQGLPMPVPSGCLRNRPTLWASFYFTAMFTGLIKILVFFSHSVFEALNNYYFFFFFFPF